MDQLIFVQILLIVLTTTLELSQPAPSCADRGTNDTKCACEAHENFSISCTNNQRILILEALYGRLENETCNDKIAPSQHWNLSCIDHNATEVLSKNCDNQPACSIGKHEYSRFFKDPCPGTGKYLLVNYACISVYQLSTFPIGQTTMKSTHQIETNAVDQSTAKPTGGTCQCQPEDIRNVSWPPTECGSSQTQNCPNNPMRKNATRWCSIDGSWSHPNLIGCKSEEIERTSKRLEGLKANFTVPVAIELMQRVENISLSNGGDLYGGDLYELTKVMVVSIELSQNNIERFTTSDADYLSALALNSTSNFLSDSYNLPWKELLPYHQSQTATRLLEGMEQSSAILAGANKNQTIIRKSAPGIEALQINVTDTKSQQASNTFRVSDLASAEISFKDLKKRASNDKLGRVVFILYNDIEKRLTSNANIKDTHEDAASATEADNGTHFKQFIITKVVSASIISDREPSRKELINPIRFTLKHKSRKLNDSALKCVFWKYRKGDFVGHWSDEGCTIVSSDEYSTTCECNHLTNFAVLMSASNKTLASHHVFTLQILTLVGCSISVAALVLTIVIYVVTWNDVKSHQAAILLNLCVSLIAANTLFIFGIDKVDHRIGCTAIAVFLQYFYLAAFFIMLVEGIQLFIYVVFVFRTRRRLQTVLLLVAAWVLPLMIVAISLGVTEAHGYGTHSACWLSIENDLIWAFLGPALFIIGVNAIIIVIVLAKLYKTRLPSSKNDSKAKIRGMIWNIAVISPLLGITWFFGIFTGYSIIFEFIFTVINSLQGLFIFIFHALYQNKKFNTRLSCKRKQQPGSKDGIKKVQADQTFLNPTTCSKGSQINSLSDAVEMQTTSADNSFAFTPISSDKPSSETGIISHTVTAETYSSSVSIPKNDTG